MTTAETFMSAAPLRDEISQISAKNAHSDLLSGKAGRSRELPPIPPPLRQVAVHVEHIRARDILDAARDERVTRESKFSVLL